MAKYVLLIYGDAQRWEARTPEQAEANSAAHAAFSTAAGSRLLGGEELEAEPTATTLRTDSDGGLVVTDGPFLETKEALGGFYLVEADDIDEVVKLASQLPEVHEGHSGVEIRPVVDHQ